ncbi:Protein 60A [Anthophora plagiata]
MYKIYFIEILFLLVIISLANSERSSGLYIDNGFNQTVLHKLASNEQKQDMERKLLNILELPDTPRRIVRRSLMVKRSAPKFLLNIYKNVLSNGTDISNQEEYGNVEEFDLSGHDINIIEQSDLIMTFGAHNPHSGNASKTNRGKRIWFDVSEVPRGEHIITAELRLYQSFDKNFELNKTYTIAIYRVARTNDGRRIKYYIASTNTTIGKEGWITLNISEALEYWVKYPKENRGLFLAVHHADYTGHIIRPDDIGIIGVLGIPDKQPFMVGFFKNSGNYNKHKIIHKQKRDIKREKLHYSSVNIQNNPYINTAMKRKKENVCNIKTLYISFKDLQWQDWIIAPEGYDAYYCSGDCNFPLNIHMNATNHAIVQTLVHLMKPHEIPKPCCAPTKLSPISVLYFLDDSNVVLKKYKNMVINSCGCH